MAPLSAQRVELVAGVSAAQSSLLLRDDVATPDLRSLLGGTLDREVTVQPAVSPSLQLGLRLPMRPRVSLELDAGWSPTELRVSEGEGTRAMQDVHVVEGSVGASWQLRDGLELGAAAGVLGYLADDRGIFAEGAALSPALRAHAGVRLPFWNGRVALRGSAQLHRFGTPAIRRVGGTDGLVTRVQAGARVSLAELGR